MDENNRRVANNRCRQLYQSSIIATWMSWQCRLARSRSPSKIEQTRPPALLLNSEHMYANEPAIIVFSFAAHCLKGGEG